MTGERDMQKDSKMKMIGKIGITAGIVFLLSNMLFGGSGESEDRIRNHLKKGALVIDVRTAGEFESGNIKDSINIPYDVIASDITKYETDKARPMMVYCRSGNRSSHAKRYLFAAGYTNVVDGGSLSNIRKYTPDR